MKLELLKLFPGDKLLFDEPMKKHSSFRAGGNASYLVLPECVEDIINALGFCKNHGLNYYIIGNGSNILVKDSGFNGMIIKMGKNFSGIHLSGDIITAKAGTLLSEAAAFALSNSLSGFEFASGIPGSIGGAIFMNAGAYGGEMKNVVVDVEVLDIDNVKTITVANGQMAFGYRDSVLHVKNYIALSARIKLAQGDKNKIAEEMKGLSVRRKEKQPVEYPSAGSTFKRPEGYFAGKLIMDSGLKGFKIGGAMVSEKHCGFIINYGNATAGDILKLMAHVTETVYKTFNVKLEPEVRVIGD
ncbi:MAG: UDP-N-acetylmuramate dehydrogenase [Clostridiales bacterium]|nr:UDP-N-acetylmuramate dehydrogenase [Clostridiales bacterium]